LFGNTKYRNETKLHRNPTHKRNIICNGNLSYNISSRKPLR